MQRLNAALGLPAEPYSRKPGDDRMTANIGCLCLDHNIGGWTVHQICNDGGGVTTPLGDYRHSAGDMCHVLRAALGAVQIAKEQAAKGGAL